MGNFVKHLLIILSLLLLSSFLTSCEKKEGTLYRWGEVPEIVWKGFGEKETHPVYKGDVKDGKPNGLGILIYPSGGKYVGEWKDGEIWNGTYNNKKGYILIKWVNGKRTY